MAEHLTVGRVAEPAGVTVRALHHYDEIGLVQPSARTAAGYRAYSASDVERLRDVLAYRRLGFGLREIADLVDDPSTDAVAHLRRLRLAGAIGDGPESQPRSGRVRHAVLTSPPACGMPLTDTDPGIGWSRSGPTAWSWCFRPSQSPTPTRRLQTARNAQRAAYDAVMTTKSARRTRSPGHP
jgi:DNA-binding transcriptional MerR regulator